MLTLAAFSELFGKSRYYFEEIANNAVGGNLEYRGVRVLIYGNYNLG